MIFRQKRIWIITAATLLLIAAGIVIVIFAQNTEKEIHKGTLVFESSYCSTSGIEGKMRDEEYTVIY